MEKPEGPGRRRDEEEELLRSVAMQNAQSILLARQRAERELVAAKEVLEARTTELERANALVRTIAENAASALLMLDERGIATYMNPAAIDQTGYTLEEFSRAPFHQVLHASESSGGHPAAECPIRIARERMLPLRKHRDIFVRKNGTTFPVSCSLSPLQREGQQAGAVLEFREITEELAAQRALEESNRRKDQFLATLSHELRTPMTSVLGWVRMLRLGLVETPEEALDAIERSARIQAQLIDDVLDVSRITAGKMTFKPMPVDLGLIAQAAVTTVHPAASAKGIEILTSIPPSLPAVLGDEGRLQQVIWNLLSNAVKFTARGGTITLRIAAEAELVRITVHDTGKGIASSYLPHVFEPFSQEDATMTRQHEGIGLGLSIARSLVELHGGRIRAASEGAGKGSTFTVELPVYRGSREGGSAASPSSASLAIALPTPRSLESLGGVRVLAIDDQPYTRDLLAAIFQSAGAEIHPASSVSEAREIFRAVKPDVVVCDLAMPEEDGLSFLRGVRALPPPLSETPVVALTAFGRPEDREMALSAGFTEYLTKPVEPETLVETIHRALARAGRAR